jgi:hypothetical protein
VQLSCGYEGACSREYDFAATTRRQEAFGQNAEEREHAAKVDLRFRDRKELACLFVVFFACILAVCEIFVR